MFGAVVAQLSAPPPTVLVVEDVLWATLDVLRYLARRIEELHEEDPHPAILTAVAA